MTTLNTVIKVDADEGNLTGDNDLQLDESEILSSTRIKQRRATVAPTAIPSAQLPRYLRDSGRYGSNRTRRQSMPAQYISKQPLPSIRLPTEANDLSECQLEIDKSSAVKEKKDIQTQPPKTPVKNCRSFPLDYRLQHSPKFSGHSYDSTENIDNSTGNCTTSPGFVIPRIGVDNNGYHHTSDLELRISSQKPSPEVSSDRHQTKLCTTAHSDKMRRHSIAVSKISDSNRIGANSTLPGMTDLGKYERYLCKSRDRIISVPSGDDSESVRISAAGKMSRYVPKPDNHLFLSIFSCLCCPMIGLVAVIFAVQVDQNYEKGKKEVSVTKSKNARYWALSAVAVGMMLIIGASMYGVIVFAMMG